MASTDINRTTTISLPGEVSSDILQKTQEVSAVMSLARQITTAGASDSSQAMTYTEPK